MGYVRDVADELTSQPHRSALAGASQQALWEARHLAEIPLGRRPPPEAEHLRRISDELEMISVAVPTNGRVSLQAVALCDQLIAGGYGSSLYTRAPADLHKQLRRIRYL